MVAFEDCDGWIWYDGEMVDWRQARAHVLTHAMHYGSSVFEGERAYNGKIFKLREHTERLVRSAEILGFEIPWSVEAIDAACEAVLERNDIKDGYVRPVSWRGADSMGLYNRESTIHLAIAAFAWPALFPMESRLEGIRMMTGPWRRPSPETAPVASKAAGLYMIGTLSKQEADKQGFDDALLLDYRGYIAEATGANIFFLIDGDLHTPTPDCFLDGITRRTVMDLARKRGFKVVERHIEPEELSRVTEAFLAGTAAEITLIRSIDGHTFTPGNVSKTLMADYDALVRG